MAYELKQLAAKGIDSAIARAEQYRALNEPDDAESICRDVLACAPGHQTALRVLGLSLTDQFPKQGWARLFDETLKIFGKLASPYERVYYTGIAWERCAKAQLEESQAHNAIHSFEQALDCFEQAEKLAPEGAADPVLRWNRCVRALDCEPLIAEARRAPRAQFDVGD
jgi:tetratricopeptide (TPR) repeat protein